MDSRWMIRHAIVLVPFPFDDLSASKVRPALCLTSEVTEFKHVVIAFISSKVPDLPIDSDLVILKGTDEWQGTGLTVDSVIRLHRLLTIPKHLISRKLGRINSTTAHAVSDRLHLLFNPDNSIIP